MSQGFYPSNIQQKYQAFLGAAWGDFDPSVQSTSGLKGTIYIQFGTLKIWQKQDDGDTTNWTPVILPAAGSTGIYPVYEGGPYATIQSAIDAAEADGANGLTNPKIVQVYPKNGGWTENITMKKGITLAGYVFDGGISVHINGKLTYAPVAGTQNDNFIAIANLFFQHNDTSIELAGTAPFLAILGELNLNSGSVNPTLICNNPSAVMVTSLGSVIQYNPGSLCVSHQAGLWISPTTYTMQSYGGRVAEILAGATANVYMPNVFCNGGTSAFDVAGTLTFILGTLQVGLAGVDGFSIPAGGVVNCSNSGIIVPGGPGYVASGVGNFNHSFNTYLATNDIQNTLTITALQTTLNPVP